MMVREGQIQEVQQDLLDTLIYRHLVDGVPTTPTSAKVSLYGTGGSLILADQPCTVSTHKISLSRTWSQSLFPLGSGYKAEWEIVTGTGLSAVTTYRRTYYSVVLRRSESQLTDTDLTDLIPYLADQLPASVTTFLTWRKQAWHRIERKVQQQMGAEAGTIFFPEAFFECHRAWTLALFFLSISRRNDDEWATKYAIFERTGDAEFQSAMARCSVDLGNDGILGADEKDRSMSVRWER